MNIFNINIAGIKEVINSKEVENIRKICSKFNKRKNEEAIQAKSFINAFVVGLSELGKVTLEGIGIKIGEYQNRRAFTKQAVVQSLKKGSILLKETLEIKMADNMKKALPTGENGAIEKFSDVKIYDATTISLPNKLSEVFTGMGGTNANSAVKIQVGYSAKTQSIIELSMCDGTKNDANYTKEIAEHAKKNELCIFDMGYINTCQFREIEKNGAYYLTRAKTSNVYYNAEGKRVNLHPILEKSNGTIDVELYVKDKNKELLKVRVLGVKLPEEKSNVKIMRERKRNKKTLTKEKLMLLGWSIFMSNIPEELLSLEEVCQLYRLRWQIELLFKSWKQYLGVGNMNNVGLDYVLCLFYGRLILITMISTIYSIASLDVYLNEGHSLSLQRFFKNMQTKVSIFLIGNKLKNRFKITTDYIIQSISDVIIQSYTEKRRKKTTRYILDLIAFYSSLFI